MKIKKKLKRWIFFQTLFFISGNVENIKKVQISLKSPRLADLNILSTLDQKITENSSHSKLSSIQRSKRRKVTMENPDGLRNHQNQRLREILDFFLRFLSDSSLKYRF